MKYVSAAIIGCSIMFLLFAFGNAGFDITHWTEGCRAFCAVCMAATSFFGCCIVFILCDNP